MKCWTLVSIVALSCLLPIFAQDGNDMECHKKGGNCVPVDENDAQECMGELDCPKGNQCCKTSTKGYDVAGLLLERANTCNQDSKCTLVGGRCIAKGDKCETKPVNNLCGQKKCGCCLESLSDKIKDLEELMKSMDMTMANKFAEMSEDIDDINNITSDTQEMVRKLLDCAECESKSSNGSNCKELLDNGVTQSGVYTITPEGFPDGVKVYCDQKTDGGGWTVIVQRKQIGVRMRAGQLDFAKNFEEYAAGFGVPTGEFWIGNRIIHAITGATPFTLRIEAKNQGSESRTGIWGTFSVGSEATEFTLSAGGYSGSSTLGDGLTHSGGGSGHGMKFSTYDRDNDGHASFFCSGTDGKGGWWYNKCYASNPTAPFYQSTTDNVGWCANFRYWTPTSTGTYIALSEIKFKIRP